MLVTDRRIPSDTLYMDPLGILIAKDTHTHKILDFAAIGEKQIVSLIVHWSLSSQPIVTVFTGELNSKQQYFPYCFS
jgi:hypothetical protein